MIDALNPYTANFSLSWDNDGSPYLRLLRIPFDDLSIMNTFLAVQSHINAVLQAEVVGALRSQVAQQQRLLSRDAGPTSARAERHARQMGEVLDGLRAAFSGAPEVLQVGSVDSIVIESINGSLISSIWVEPQYLTSTEPSAFEGLFNERLQSVLVQRAPTRGGVTRV